MCTHTHTHTHRSLFLSHTYIDMPLCMSNRSGWIMFLGFPKMLIGLILVLFILFAKAKERLQWHNLLLLMKFVWKIYVEEGNLFTCASIFTWLLLKIWMALFLISCWYLDLLIYNNECVIYRWVSLLRMYTDFRKVKICINILILNLFRYDMNNTNSVKCMFVWYI